MIDKGKNMVVSLDGVEVLYQDSFTLSFDVDMLEILGSSTTSREYINGLVDGTLQLTGLAGIDNTQPEPFNFEDLRQKMLAGSVTLTYNLESYDPVRTFQVTAFVQSISLNAETKGFATYSATFQLSGDITEV